MTDTVEVEVDGVVDDRSPGRTPAWGVPAAIAVVGVLTLAVIVRVVAPGLVGREAPTPGRSRAPTSTTVPIAEDARIVAAREALSAWGRFATTGDFTALDGRFDPDGPQYQQLAREAGQLRPASGTAEPYMVTLSDVRLGDALPAEASIVGTVVWTRPTETDQHYSWKMVLRSADGKAWRLWTVRTCPC